MSYKRQPIPRALRVAIWNKYIEKDNSDIKTGELNITIPNNESFNRSIEIYNSYDIQKIIKTKLIFFNNNNIIKPNIKLLNN